MKPAVPAGHLARLIEHLAPGESRLRRRQPALFESGTGWAPMLEEAPAPLASAPSPVVVGLPTEARPRLEAAQVVAPTPHARLAPPRLDPTVRAPVSLPHAQQQPVAAESSRPVGLSDAELPPPSKAAATMPAPLAAVKSVVRAKVPEPQPALRAHALEAQAASPRESQRGKPQHGPSLPQATAAAHTPPATRAEVRRQAAAIASRPAALAAPPPTPAPVSISIGRIEVRATPTSAHPPQQAARSPQRLSLDQYLRQRGETGRGSR